MMEQGDAHAGLRLGAALWRFCVASVHLAEGRERLAALLSLPGAEARTVERARALNAAGVLAHHQGDPHAAQALLEECLAIFRESGDAQGVAYSLIDLGYSLRYRHDYEAAHALHEEGLAIFRALDDRQGIAHSVGRLGYIALDQGEFAAARTLHEEGLAIFRALDNQGGIAGSLGALGGVARKQGDYEAARALLEESLAIFRALDHPQGIINTLGALGHVEREAGEYARCAAHYRESMRLRQSDGGRFAIAQSLEDFAGLAGRQRRWERAVRLLGATDSVAHALGHSLPVALPEEYEQTAVSARAALGDAAFAAAWATGRAMSLEQSCAYALADDAQWPPDTEPPRVCTP